MEIGSLTVPNLFSFDRLTGKGVFFQSGVAGGAGVELGDIDMLGIDYGASKEAVDVHINGSTVLGREDTVKVRPVFSIKGKQFHTTLIPLLALGTSNAAANQASATGATVNITAALGMAYDLGARNILNVAVTVSASAKTPDVDYFIDPVNGIIRFPLVAAGIAAGASVVVTFDKSAVSYESYTMFNKLNRVGTLKVFENDDRYSAPKNIWTMPGTLTSEGFGEGDPEKTKQWALRFAIIGQPTLLRLAA